MPIVHDAHLLRARLNQRLVRATQYPIALILAPAGFGKSVALRDFLFATRLDAVRLEVRREENTFLAFTRRFCEVLAPIAPSITASFPAMQERALSASDPPRLTCDWFVEHLKRTNATIVVDDLHFAAEDSDSILFLAELVDRTSEHIKWIVASRSDSGLPIASWLAYGHMDLPVDEKDLRFTLDEALAAAQIARTEIHPSELESLCELTQGWPVALAIALRTHTSATELRTSATRDMLYRYLAEQVLAGVLPSQREFLLATSIFPAFNVSIAQALGGTFEFIDDLRRGVAFLTETSPGEYRYHDLFRDFLESELLRRGPAVWQRALATGAHLLESAGDAAGALALYTRATDAPSIVRIVERSGFQLLERGEADRLDAALQALPDTMRRERPAIVGLQAALSAARGHADLARSQFAAAIERANAKDLRLALVHRYAIELVRQNRDCIELLEPHASDGNVPPQMRVPLLGTLATALAGRSRPEAVATIATALDLLDPAADDDSRARLYQQAAYVYIQGNDYVRAREYAMLALEFALPRRLYDVGVRAYSVLYQIAYDEADDPMRCLKILDNLLDCARKAASSQGRLYGLMASYGIEADRGDETALDRIDALLSAIPGMLPKNRGEVLLPAMALQAAWARDFKRAYHLRMQTAEDQNEERRSERFSEVALYAAAAGMGREAEAAANAASQALAKWGKPSRRALRARVLLVFLELLRGHTGSAHRLLLEAESEITASMGRIGALANAARVLYRVTIGQAEHAHLVGALERLRIEQLGGFARLIEAVPFPASSGGGLASLTAAEREILKLLATGVTTKEMAERTARSPHTIDAHVRSICKKLRCRGRRAAVALATGAGWVNGGRA
jgi:ATP/maltotriose-dependent transcriptional regulator MalT